MKNKQYISILLGSVFFLVVLSWIKFLTLDTIKVDQTPLSSYWGYVVVIGYVVGLFLYAKKYANLINDENDVKLSILKIKKWAYIHLGIASFMLPFLSNDIFLYLAYGDLSNQGIDVFTQTGVLEKSKWFEYIGSWKNSPYLYGPITLWQAKISNWIGGDSIWGVLITFKFIQLLIGICFIEILSLMVKNTSDYVYVSLSPILWLQNLGCMHYDLLAGFFLLGSIYFITHKKIVFASLLIGFAVATKMVYFIYAPFISVLYFIVYHKEIKWKSLVYYFGGISIFVVALVGSYFPFWTSIKTFLVPLEFLQTQEPSKSFSEVLGELFNIIFTTPDVDEQLNKIEVKHDDTKWYWWNLFKIIFQSFGALLAIWLTSFFIYKTRFKANRITLSEYWVKLSMIFYFFFSHIFNAWYLIAFIPFIPYIGKNKRLKNYLLVIMIFSNVHMIFLNIDRTSYLYYALPPIVLINVCLFFWQFKKNYFTIEAKLVE